MKKRYIIPIALLALSSCSRDFLEQENPNAVTISNYYKTENDVLLAINGLYQGLRSGSTVGEGSTIYNEERSDNTGRNDNQSNAGEPFQFNDFSLLPSNTYLKTHWAAMYDIIARCNSVLTHIDAVTFANPALKQRYTSEAKFIRAFIYFDLVRKFGDIPVSTEEITTKERANELAFRVKEAEVYQQIVKDLTDALNSDLPKSHHQYQVGKVSKTAVNALLGKVYLTMALTLAENKSQNFVNAEKYLTDAYNLRGFGKLSEIPYASVFDVNNKMTNKELIFQVQYLQGNQNYNSSIARNYQARGETVNSQYKSTGAGEVVKLDLVKDYEANDIRKDFSVKYASNAQVKDWFVTKFRDTSDAAGTAGYGGNDWILIRYADVILLLAETKMSIGKNSEAIALLDEVRTRAGLPSYAVSVANPAYSSKYPTLKDAILHERRVELAFENQRWFDLVRNYSSQELVQYFVKKSQSDYGNAKLSNFNTKDRYYPIPFDEVKLDPTKMYQNPNY